MWRLVAVPARFPTAAKVHLVAAHTDGRHRRWASYAPLCGVALSGAPTPVSGAPTCRRCLASFRASGERDGRSAGTSPAAPGGGGPASDTPEGVTWPECVLAFTLVPMSSVPEPHHLFRPMDRYREADWRAATRLASDALLSCGAESPALRAVARHPAARSLLRDPVKLSTDHPTLVNGQHRTQAMREQGLHEVLVRVCRERHEAPLGLELLVVPD